MKIFLRLLLLHLLVLTPVILLPGAEPLADGFAHPPESTKPWCYWYWVSDNVSKEGITRDLEAMKQFGLGEAFIGNVDVNDKNRGTTKVFSEEWWQLVDHAIREGGRIGVNIGMFNCPGWSQSGGPWVRPDQTMRYVAVSETRVTGPQNFSSKLVPPNAQFQDIAVLAFPAPQSDADTIATHAPRVHCTPTTENAAQLCDGKLDTVCAFPKNISAKEPFTVDLEVAAPFTARSLTLYPSPQALLITCELQAEGADGKFSSVKKFVVDRSNPGPGVGPMHFGPVAVSFPPVTAKHFRLVFTNQGNNGGLAEIELSGAARLDHFVEKQLGKMFQTPLPLWNAYLWPAQAEAESGFGIEPKKILNLSGKLAADGTLNWDVPAGDWIILRTGMTPTGVRNGPASPEGSGLEIDKMNRKLVGYHFGQFIGKELARLPASERTAFKHVVADSYEMGPQNWTDGMAEDFRKTYGYDPLPWLPVLTGRIVGSADQSDRFLWDIRRMVADRISYNYVGGLREESEKRGLRMWLENYGHWGFPGEFLQYGGQCSDVSGEFWTGGDLGSVELRAASSAAHIYGKKTVTSESWTSGGPHWTLDPWLLKLRGDWAMTEGINHFLLHVYIQQPDERKPGMNSWFGTEFNRHNTWFSQGRDWVDYLKRSSFLLQQGRYVADVAYFIGEDAPKMTGTRQPALPSSYSFDYINGEVIEKNLAVKDGRFVLPNGMSYRVLVLPPLDTMRPELLKKIRALVKAGGIILGPPPLRSPSMKNFPACDREIQKLAAELWQNCDGKTVTSVRFGQGRVFRADDLQKVLNEISVAPDLAGVDKKTFPWLHRTTADGEVYFISNQSDEAKTIAPGFRVNGRQPELWDAVTGTRRELPEFQAGPGSTVVPLEFAPRQSLFVVFRKPAKDSAPGAKNFPALKAAGELSGAWTVKFDPKWGGPESVVFDSLTNWTQRAEDGIKYYSGTAKYLKTFDAPALQGGQKLFLDLGELHNLARVRLNGRDLGLVWCAPWRVEISSAVKTAGNELELEVVNTWNNRLVGDTKLPVEQRLTWTAVGPVPNAGQPPLNPASPLLPAGLVGPVKLFSAP